MIFGYMISLRYVAIIFAVDHMSQLGMCPSVSGWSCWSFESQTFLSRRDDGCFEGRRVLKESGSLPESNILRIEHSDHFAHCHFQATNCCNHSHSFVVLPHSLAKFNVRMFCSLSFCARDCWFLFVFDGPTRKVRRFCLKSVYLFAFYVKRCCHLLHTGPATGD